jgi:hypothetical protein
MSRVQVPVPVLNSERASMYLMSAMQFEFWNTAQIPEIHVQEIKVDSRMNHMLASQKIRQVLGKFFRYTNIQHLDSSKFCVHAPDLMLVCVENYNHRSQMRDRINEYVIQVYGDESLVCEVAGGIRETLSTERLVKVNWFFKGSHGLDSTNLHIDADQTQIHDEFYPWFREGVNAFVQDYMHSRSSVLVLYGPPGTGKTSFLRHLLVSTQSNAMITYDDQVIQDDAFFVDYLTDDEHDVLIVEDADVLLSPREDGANHIMSKFLNVSDGLIRVKNKKMVFTTNITQMNKIDQALLRPGRCFAAVNFRELSATEAAQAARVAGTPERDWHSQNHWSLAQIWGEHSDQSHMHAERFRVGFGI